MRNLIVKLFNYAGKYKKYALYCFVFVLGEVLCEMMMPLLMARIVDEGIPKGSISFIAFVGLQMVLLAAVAIIFGAFNMKFSAEAAQGFGANLRKLMFDKIQSFSFSNIDSFSTGSLVTRLTNDVSQMQITLMMSLRMLLRAPTMMVAALIFAMSINFKLSGVIFAAIPVLALGIFLVLRTAEKLFSLMQSRLDDLNGTVQENLVAIRAIKAFVREGNEILKFKKVNDAFTSAGTNAGYIISMMMPLMIFVLNSATIAVIWFGGKMAGGGEMGTGELISFISYLMQILMSVMMFSMIFILFARAKASAKRILEVVDTKVDIEDKLEIQAVLDSGDLPKVSTGKIEFKNVNFRYTTGGEGKNVLSDISFTINGGEVAAIVGGTGSGKSSLLNLIPRLYDVTAGQVLVDGHDVRDYSLQELRKSIGMVMQKNVLFTGSIRDNLKWGDESADQETIEKFARDAQADEFIKSFPGGYDTELGQGGVNVSGGQKQRLCIARAMIKRPRVLILDDSTSAVDTATEAKIRKAFYENLKDTTVILVAQRISSVRNADKIIVLEDGSISGIGTHETLYEDNTVYREICISQQEGLVS